jgi:transposase
MRTKRSATELEARRRRAAEYFQAGKSLRTIARLLDVSLTSVKRWKRAWKTGGVDALAAKPHPGAAPKLSEKQKQKLVEILLAGPIAAGYRTNLWTCARVAEVVRKRIRVKYHPGHLSRILHDLGFSPQKPRQVAREQDPEAVERWRKHDWPRIKKKHVAGAQALFLSMKPAFACSRLIAAPGRLRAKRPSNEPGTATTA